jgi:hypothetical protein
VTLWITVRFVLLWRSFGLFKLDYLLQRLSLDKGSRVGSDAPISGGIHGYAQRTLLIYRTLRYNTRRSYSGDAALSGLRVSDSASDFQVRRNHRRAVMWQIIFPVALTALVIVVVLVVLVFALSSGQLDTAASLMSLCVLLPTALLCLIPYVLFVATFAGTRRLYFWLPPRLRTVRSVARRANTISRRLSSGVTRPVIAISQRLTWIEHLTSRQLRKRLPRSPREREPYE